MLECKAVLIYGASWRLRLRNNIGGLRGRLGSGCSGKNLRLLLVNRLMVKERWFLTMGILRTLGRIYRELGKMGNCSLLSSTSILLWCHMREILKQYTLVFWIRILVKWHYYQALIVYFYHYYCYYYSYYHYYLFIDLSSSNFNFLNIILILFY